jgi:uncharacterized phage protein (TIGR01671 family)
MREIKFRAINKRTGEIEYIDDMYWFEENGVHGMDGKGHFDEYWMDEFTGLKDKNGVEIYEDDVLHDSRCEQDAWYADAYKVIFVNCTARFAMQPIDIYMHGEAEWTIDGSKVIVTGNMHSLPE